MKRTLVHIAAFLLSFSATLWLVKNDVGERTRGARYPPRTVRQWAPEDTAFVAFLVMKEADSRMVRALFDDVRFGFDDGVAARFSWKRDTTEERNAPYWWLFTDSSVARGRKYLSLYQEFLDSVASPFGVSPAVIAAMLRTESDFGMTSGTHRVANALYTAARLMTDSLRRNEELRELSCVLRIMRGKGLDSLLALRGSWRGAFGLVQFRPSSYLAYAIDGDRDGVINLFTLPDAVVSASNYLRAHGWSPSPRDQWRALYAYNRRAYANAVLSYAERISAE
ncbi:MAG: lytic murein transglycosylase [Candidatus Jorgensenbacteria bacterium]|nr:lytic murein transglycosylase [Candidatus Jorgensenbacteria bacterium]